MISGRFARFDTSPFLSTSNLHLHLPHRPYSSSTAMPTTPKTLKKAKDTSDKMEGLMSNLDIIKEADS